MQNKRRKKKKRMGAMDRILIILGLVLGGYTVTALVLFWHTGSEPSTLTMCIFGLATAEGGFMSLIQKTKVKNGGTETSDGARPRGAAHMDDGEDL